MVVGNQRDFFGEKESGVKKARPMSPSTPNEAANAQASSNDDSTTNTTMMAVDEGSMKRPAAAAAGSTSRKFQAKKTRVLVLGAGMSGLACARELQHRGYQVLVVEARDRLGGRLKGGVKTNDREGGNEGMKTLPNPLISPDNKLLKPKARVSKKDTSTAVDLGGALIHGIQDNPIYAITEQMGIPTCPVSECLLFDQSGWPLDTKEDERMSGLFNECLEETFDRVAKQSNKQSNTTASASTSTTDSGSTPDSTMEVQPTNSITDISDNKEEETPTDPGSGKTDVQLITSTQGDKKAEEVLADSGLGKGVGATTPEQATTNTNDVRRASKRKGRARSQPSGDHNGVNNDTLPDTSGGGDSGGDTETKAESFGSLFEKVCKEKHAPMSDMVFQWHQANLEIFCGASFPDLGYTWNDDEPYGYDGAHVAVKTSWKPVLEGLAEAIDVLYQSPVKQIVMVVPDPPPEPPPEIQPQTPGLSSDTKKEEAASNKEGQVDAATPSARIKRKRSRPATPTPLPSRRSRRLKGDDADARRSSRANKGQPVDRFLVTAFSKNTYEGDESLQSPSQRTSRQKQQQENSEADEEHTTVQVTLEDGTVLEAEAVVCTLPLGILKLEPEIKKQTEETEESSGGISFYPPLSERKQAAIQRLGCGLLNKCVLSFPHVFWQQSDFLALAHPANSYLILNVSSFTNKPILTFMYGGAFAKEIESWTDNEIVADCMEVLRIICGRRDIPNPLDYTVTRWGHERFSRMSFSYVPPGVDGVQEFKALSEPVYDPLVPRKPVLLFAGEHTHPFHPSTIHGAFSSGIREAYRLDLFVEAEANGNLEFEDEHLYQHTFWVRRQFHSPKSPVARAPRRTNSASTREPKDANENQANSDTKGTGAGIRRPHRRRAAAGVMTLREKPKTILPELAEDPASSERRRKSRSKEPLDQTASVGQNGLSVSPARRSRRSVHTTQQQKILDETTVLGATAAVASTPKKAPPSSDEDLIEKKRLQSLESRTLMRALESYGHDYPYISSVVFPVFGGSSAPKSIPQVRARCQQLIRSIISSASAQIPKRLLTNWVAENVHVPPPPDQKPQKAAASKKAPSESKPRAEGTRKSSRHHKHRTLMDL